MTGRQRVLNMTRLLEHAPAGFELLCDLRDHGFFERFGIPAAGRYCDTRFFVFTRPFFDAHLRRLYLEPRPAGGANTQPGRLLLPHRQGPGAHPRGRLPFPHRAALPRSGRALEQGYGSPRNSSSQAVRAAGRRLFPGLRF